MIRTEQKPVETVTVYREKLKVLILAYGNRLGIAEEKLDALAEQYIRNIEAHPQDIALEGTVTA